jgi:phage/plasmid-associated DNA primase
VQADLNALQRRGDTVNQFIAARCETSPEFRQPAANLQEAYRLWCERRRQHPVSRQQFAQRMRQLGFVGAKRSSNFYVGIQLRTGTRIPDADPSTYGHEDASGGTHPSVAHGSRCVQASAAGANDPTDMEGTVGATEPTW